MFDTVFEKLLSIEQLSNKNSFRETWGNLSMEGNGCGNGSFFKELSESLTDIGCSNALSLFIDNSQYQTVDEFVSDLGQLDNWRINLNKNAIVQSNNEYKVNFFYSIDSLKQWIKESNPLATDYFANNGKYKVFVNGLKKSFGGNNFIFCSQDENFNSNKNGYNQEALNDTLHLICSNEITICPQNHYLSFGDVNDVTRYFYRNSIIVLLIALSNEYHDLSDEVVLKGYRRLSLKIGLKEFEDNITKEYQDNLYSALQWVYETGERADLRLKLLLERITLDVDFNESYPHALCFIIKGAFTQAKERYSFITYERKDKYDKELKVLLNDTKKLCDSYSSKIRGVLSNLLRDVLAAFIMIGITQLSKVSDLQQLKDNNLIKYVFIAFGWYFIVSAVFQLVIDALDVVRSYKELKYWKQLTKEYMIKSEYDSHIKATVLKRLWWSAPFYVVLILVYIGIGICCFYLPKLLNMILQ